MRKSPLRKVSKKRATGNRLYLKAKKEYLEEHPVCEVYLCSEKSTDLHHKKGRICSLLWDKEFFLACCGYHHNLIEKNRTWAMYNGYSLDRLKRN